MSKPICSARCQGRLFWWSHNDFKGLGDTKDLGFDKITLADMRTFLFNLRKSFLTDCSALGKS